MCDVCYNQECETIKNYKNTGWDVCYNPDCIAAADERNETMDNDDMKDLDGLEKAIKNTDKLLNEILIKNLEFDKLYKAINKNSKVSYALGCRFDGVMRVEDGESLLLYTDMKTTRTTFSVLCDQDFPTQLKEVHERFNAAPVKIGQGDNEVEWTPELIEGRKHWLKRLLRI